MEVTKRFSWAMAHRLCHGYPGKCRNIHGHTYHCEVTLYSATEDQYGMAFDFGLIKRMMAGWVDEHLDHTLLIADSDLDLRNVAVMLKTKWTSMPAKYRNTTAENMAHWMLHEFVQMLKDNDEVSVASVKVWETDTSSATYAGGNWYAHQAQ